MGSKLTNLDCGQIKFSKEKIQNFVEGSKLTNLVDLEVPLPISKFGAHSRTILRAHASLCLCVSEAMINVNPSIQN